MGTAMWARECDDARDRAIAVERWRDAFSAVRFLVARLREHHAARPALERLQLGQPADARLDAHQPHRPAAARALRRRVERRCYEGCMRHHTYLTNVRPRRIDPGQPARDAPAATFDNARWILQVA
jgi:hypothetical protein